MGHIEDCQTLVNFLALDCRTGGEPQLHHNFILLDVVSNHAFFGSYLKKSGNIQKTETFNVDWSALFVNAMVAMWIDFLYSCTLIELVSINDSVDFLISSPIYEISEHKLHFSQVELSGATKSQKVMVIEVQLLQIGNLCRLNPLFELYDALVHFRRCVSHEASLDWLSWF